MKCPKCNIGNQNGNFCSECGMQLKEKCDIHKQWEPIGSSCQTKIKEVRKEMKKFVKDAMRQKSWTVANAHILTSLFCPFVMILSIIIIIISELNEMKWLGQFLEYAYRNFNLFGISGRDNFDGLMSLLIGIFITSLSLGPITILIRKNESARKKAEEEFFQEFPKQAEIIKKAKEEGNER